MKRIVGIFFCYVFLFNGQNVFAEESYDYSDPLFASTVEMISMEEHGNHDLASCNVKQLYYEEVAEMFKKGMTKQEILDYYVNEQGIQALKAPPVEGFNLLLWILPFLLILFVFLLIILLIKKWKRNNELVTQVTMIMEEEENDIYSLLIEEERRKYF